MTVVTIVAAGDVVCVFADRNDAIVTGAAAAQHLCVVDCEGGCENIRVVAVLTDVSGLNVVRAFAGFLDAIVATNAVS